MMNKTSKYCFSIPVAAVLFFAVVCALLIFGAVKVHALSGSDFKAGRIIDDSVFYNDNTMSASQIQTFLNSKVSVCDTNGEKMFNSTQTRAEWAAANGKPEPPYICLKDYSQNVPTVTNGGSDLCKQSIPGGTKSAAQIIYDVSKACGINPQVLIVLLQKEQTLVTDDWPWPIQYRSATGYGCPDTAPCDSEYYGFFNQVYQAAKAFRRYEANPDSYNYKAGRNNTILWHPNTACGSSTVFIENQATANLYIYTPYRPNQAALNNLRGTGDNCSSYGNRNFWVFFNDWFGSTHTTEKYAAKIKSVKIYSDSLRENEISNNSILKSNEKVYVRIRATNIGLVGWDKSIVRLGTTGPFNHVSLFESPDWINSARPTTFSESNVPPYAIGTFDFVITAPENDGDYSDNFRLLAEGAKWMSDTTTNYTLRVQNPYNAEIISSKGFTDESLTSSKSLKLKPSESMYWGIIAKNTGFNSWDSSLTKIGTDKPKNRESNLYTPLWPHISRPAFLIEDVVSVGQNGSFKFPIKAPSAPGLYRENFQIVVEGVAWMPSGYFKLPVRVFEGKDRMQKILWLEQNESLSSAGYLLVMQGDGNLVVYNRDFRAIWSSGTKTGHTLALQGDGNLVLYDKNLRALWSSGTRGGSILIMQGDGNLVLYDKNLRALWSSGTRGL